MFRLAVSPTRASLDASALTLFQVTAGSGSPWGRQGSCTLLPTSTVMSLGTLVNTGVTARQGQGLPRTEPGSSRFAADAPPPVGAGPGHRVPSLWLGRDPVSCQEEARQDLWGFQPPRERQPQGSGPPVHVAPALRASPRPRPPGTGDEAGGRAPANSPTHGPSTILPGQDWKETQSPSAGSDPGPNPYRHSAGRASSPLPQARPPTTRGHRLAVDAQPTELQEPTMPAPPMSRIPTADMDDSSSD